jgi:hypothetical protein
MSIVWLWLVRVVLMLIIFWGFTALALSRPSPDL